MDVISELPQIRLSKSLRDPQGKDAVLKSLKKQGDSRAVELPSWTYQKVEIKADLKDRVVADIELAKEVLIDVGYSSQEIDGKLPRIEEITFYRSLSQFGGIINGNAYHESRGIRIILGPSVTPDNWSLVGPILTHELGHCPANRVYSGSSDQTSVHRLISFGFDRRVTREKLLGKSQKQPDWNSNTMSSVLREPLADIFRYYCTKKRNDGTSYSANYYRETAFLIAFIDQLSRIRGTQFFTEFSKLYKAFNEQDYGYYATLRRDYVKFFLYTSGTDEATALKRATDFVSSLNSIQTTNGKDCILTEIEGDPLGVHIRRHDVGKQLTEVAKKGGFNSEFGKNVSEIHDGLLVLDQAETRMKLYLQD